MRLSVVVTILLVAACVSTTPVETITPTTGAAASAPQATVAGGTATATPRTAAQATPTPTATVPPTPTTAVVASAEPPPEGVRACAYDPLLSVPADMPPEVTDREPPHVVVEQPANTPVDRQTTDDQLQVFNDLIDIITNDYVYIDLVSLNFPALKTKYETLIEGGLTDDDFYLAMDNLIFELGDEHSDFEDPQEVIELEEETSGNADYVGVGVLMQPVPDANRAVIVLTYPGGSAREGGVRAHDAILAVDGQPILDEEGVLQAQKVRGPEGTEVTLTIQTPGEVAHDVTLERRRISSAAPVDFCMIPRTGVAYVMLPTLFDQTIPRKMREAMRSLTDAGPLEGLILDNRVNGGGFSTVLEDLLALFTEGTLGNFVSRDDSRPLEIEANEIGNSQTVPMVVLVDLGTVSFAEVLSGVLQNSGRAQVVGQTTLGNVEVLWGYDFDDGSRAWIAHDAFEPKGLGLGVWEETGIVPDVSEPTRWDRFSEGTDPALPVALDLLADQGVPVP